MSSSQYKIQNNGHHNIQQFVVSIIFVVSVEDVVNVLEENIILEEEEELTYLSTHLTPESQPKISLN